MGETTVKSPEQTTETAAKKSFFKGLKAEFKKIIWPNKDALIKQTTTVVIVTFILGVLIAAVDFAIKFGIDKLLNIV